MTRQELEQITICRPDEQTAQEIKRRWDHLAKPLDGLGEFETLLARIGAAGQNEELDLRKKAVIVMCADNGIVEEHISQSGREVTAQVAAAMGRRESSVCRMAEAVGADVFPVDVGICGTEQFFGVLPKKAASGTKNFLKVPAMTEEEALFAIKTGMDMAEECKKQGYRLLATGEMGIGNTTTSSAMAAAMLSCPVEEITGRGAGLSDVGLRHKVEVIKQALAAYQFKQDETFRILTTVGGLDIAGMTGVFIGGALYRIPVVMDGVISAVAAWTAERLVPGVREYLIPSHKSREPAGEKILSRLGLHPVIDAGLALGEGTGAVMMFGLLDIACSVYKTGTTFSDISVQPYQRFGSGSTAI